MKTNDEEIDDDDDENLSFKSAKSNNLQNKKFDENFTNNTTTGFDMVVQKERQKRKQTFGPNVKKIRKPNNILIDIYGVIAPWTFVNKLKIYAKDNLEQYVRENWNNKIIRQIVDKMFEQISIDNQAGIKLPKEIIESQLKITDDNNTLIDNAIYSLRWMLDNKYKNLRLQMEKLCTDLWSNSFETGRLKADIYPDVIDAFNYWRFEEFIKIYTYASGPVDGQRQFLRSTLFGDLNRFIANGINSSGGYKFDSNKYKSLLAALRESRPDNLLYITDDPRKARAAETIGIRTVIVNRTGKNIGKYDSKEIENLLVVNTLADIEFYNDPNINNNQTINCC